MTAPTPAPSATHKPARHHLPLLLLPALLLGACQSKLQVDLAVSSLDGASALSLAVPTVNLKDSGGTVHSYDTGYDSSLDLLPYSSDDQDHSDRLALLDEDNVSGDFTGVRPVFKISASYLTLDDGTKIPLVLGDQADYADLSFSLSKSSTSGNDTAHLVLTLELPFSLIHTSDSSYTLKPVVRVAKKDESGNISGTIPQAIITGSTCGSAAGSGVAVYAYKGSGVTPVDYYNDGTDQHSYQPIASSALSYDSSNEDYTFELRYLPAGSYTLALTCNAGDDQPDTDDALDFLSDYTQNVSVSSGATASVTLQ
ncbi:hypothetical protein SAMN04488038_11568 [Solimonas aquatica]|uniref:DUF4382 domain-containing protein n=1 Tax=Solimonas aquatica TaxID=489703 RepID=A0A1H9L9C3_9GAMM|nr:hypothetical protein [Solimonas aquatica]SER07819.1 hypothetical protein SAMN04488038_11568 [Solimonas aquatica]